MTWDINNFATLSRSKEGGTVTFGDDSKGHIIGYGNVKIGASPIIKNVALVNNLKHNRLIISQLCDKSFKVIFDSTTCIAVNDKNTCIFFGFRESNVYITDLINLDCYTKYFSL